jgi:hypothetical protein
MARPRPREAKKVFSVHTVCRRGRAASDINMDSLLYLGADEEDDDDDDDEEEEEEEETPAQEPEKKDASAGSGSLDFAALQRAGYSTATDLRETATYKLLGEAEEREREAKRLEAEAAAVVEAARLKAAEEAQEALLNQKKQDEKAGYKKRFDQTGENFRAKEKRKREQGQQSRCERMEPQPACARDIMRRIAFRHSNLVCLTCFLYLPRLPCALAEKGAMWRRRSDGYGMEKAAITILKMGPNSLPHQVCPSHATLRARRTSRACHPDGALAEPRRVPTL